MDREEEGECSVYFPRKLVVAVLLTLVAAGSLALAVGAGANSGARSSERAVFRSSLAPCVTTDPIIHNVGPCTASWSLEKGSVRLGKDGSLDLKVKGLVFTATGTALPVNGIAAALFCGPDSNTTPAATTGVFPLSANGDGAIHTTVTLPSRCLAPIVLVNFRKGSMVITTRYIALTGFTT
jgi:hypothetical protein